MSNKIKLGFVGGGNDSLIGVLHKVAAVMFDRYHLLEVCLVQIKK